jgi:ATP-binding protein involved in chromosome partitioning
MAKRKSVEEILKTIIEPETGKSVIDSGMVKNIEQEGDKVKITLVPLSAGCAFCWIMGSLISEIEEKLKEEGYDAEVELTLE